MDWRGFWQRRVNKFLPFIWDRELREIYLQYLYAPDKEIERKLGVYRGFILNEIEKAHNERKQSVLWRIQWYRERTNRRRGWIGELTGWLSLIIGFAGFVTGVLASDWVKDLWNAWLFHR